MATLTIRNVDEDLKAILRIRAAMNGKSMEEELRSILRQALIQPVKDGGLGTRLAKRFEMVGQDIELPTRSSPRLPPQFGTIRNDPS